MAGILAAIRKLNGMGNRAIAEPYAGGAGASLSLLFLEEANEIFINDADPSIYAFWWTLTNRPQPFLDLLASRRATMAEWRRQREIYRKAGRASRLRRGFSAFYLNRCNRSGIIMNGGPIGGVKQDGKWKLDARFNRADLMKRCEKVAEYRNRITVSGKDGIDFIRTMDTDTNFLFIDPPYYEKGPSLYLNALNPSYHARLANQLRTMGRGAWVLTYDDCPEIRSLYSGWASIKPFGLRYAAAKRRKGNELLITPTWMSLPKTQDSAAIAW